MKYPIIGFTGPAGCGKTQATKALPEAVRFSFADPIKRMLMTIGVPHENLYDPGKKEQPLDLLGGQSARTVLQRLGTDWGRNMICQDLWLRVAEQDLTHLLADRFVLIDDVRFDNEAALIRKLGGTTIEIVRPGVVRGVHASERGIDPRLIDRTITNDGSAEAFAAKVRLVCV